MKPTGFLRILLPALALISACAPRMIARKPAYDYTTMDKESARVHRKVEQWLDTASARREPLPLPPGVRIDSLHLHPAAESLAVYFNKSFAMVPFRPENVAATRATIAAALGKKYRGYKLALFAMGLPIEALIPNYYRPDASQWDTTRLARSRPQPLPIVRRIDRPWQPLLGLLNRTIDVRPSHGWYYNSSIDRWEWQRPRMFETVEDLLTYSLCVFYLIPMLENAGAVVFTPRERDIQTQEVVVDESAAAPAYSESGPGWQPGQGPGFAPGEPPWPVNHNPFLQGGHRICRTDGEGASQALWTPDIPAAGDYAVYVSYRHSAENSADALYIVHHAGGETRFHVNQQIGGSTWIYLGTFRFEQGSHPGRSGVLLSSQSQTPGRLLSADAVRFGGGMGNILRNGMISGKPRFAEGARYWLQYAGFPDTLIYNLNKGVDDYRDDYHSRSEYLNYLYGAPFGPRKNRSHPGLGVPVDCSIAFHTDAGITRNDTTIGTLGIYSYPSAEGTWHFPDGVSRLANRDLTDLLQSQLVDDLRRLFDPAWNRRALLDMDYSEAMRPQVPSTLLELLSHQNFLDMKFGLDPQFRFAAARAIYKAILRFVAFQNQRPCVVQPLPVDYFSALPGEAGEALLRWRPVSDPLEPTAAPSHYVVYTRREEGGFDNGTLTEQPQLILRDLKPGVLYSFRVTAANAGGESFPSETLALCRSGDSRPPVLVVNAFDRVAPPAWIDGGPFSGFADFIDAGVPDRCTIGRTGRQLDMASDSPFRSNDAPGHGASAASDEARLIAGNSFDFTALHGRAIRSAGRSFFSCSDEALADGSVDLRPYRLVDLILGEEKKTSWPTPAGDSLHGPRFEALPPGLRAAIDSLLNRQGGLLLSGSYIGSDPCAGRKEEDPGRRFVENRLRYSWTAGHASSDGRLFSSDSRFWPRLQLFSFNTLPDAGIYAAEAPDAIDPVNGGRTILRYAENNYSAAVAWKKGYGVVALGFPFETIRAAADRESIMRAALDYLAAPEPPGSR